MVSLEEERRKARDFLAGKPGVDVEIVRIPVRNGIDTTEVKEERPEMIEAEQKLSPLQRIEQYRRIIKEEG